jgi:predicted nucleic acid-binding protein
MMAVVDASVALKFQFHDEEATGAAGRLLANFVEGKIDLVAPTLFTYEIVSAVHVAINRKRIDEAVGYKAVSHLVSLGIRLCGFDDLIDATFRLARKHGLSPYDCSYLALAERIKCDFITGDRKLYNSCRNKIRRVKWIGDYSDAGAPPPPPAS